MRTAIEHYEAALKEAFPGGASGDVFHHWNEARKALKQPAQDEPVAVHQFRVQGCSDWYDGHPDYSDGTEAYETRTLYTRPQAREPLSEDERLQLRCQWISEIHGPLTDYLIQKTEAAHGIGEKK